MDAIKKNLNNNPIILKARMAFLLWNGLLIPRFIIALSETVDYKNNIS